MCCGCAVPRQSSLQEGGTPDGAWHLRSPAGGKRRQTQPGGSSGRAGRRILCSLLVLPKGILELRCVSRTAGPAHEHPDLELK